GVYQRVAVIAPPVRWTAEGLLVIVLPGFEDVRVAHAAGRIGSGGRGITGGGELIRGELGEAQDHVVRGVDGDGGVRVPLAAVRRRRRRVLDPAALHE